MSLTPAGWYPDPGNPNYQRWWDSVQWGPQVRPAFQTPPPPPPMYYMPPAKQAASTRLRKTNGIGFAGAVVGIGSFIVNPFCAASVVGMVLCIIGLVKDERMRSQGVPVAGRGWMIAGLILSCVTLLIYGAILVNGVTHLFSPTGSSVPSGPTTNA